MSNASRELVVDTVVRLVAEHGLEGASVRRVATAAGVSIGMVQHHFPTKDAMLHAAMEAVGTSFRERAARACAGKDAAAALRSLVHEMLPLDGRRRDEGLVWLAFVARGAVDPALGAEHARSWVEVEDVLARHLARHHGREEDAVDRTLAGLLLGLVDGLAIGGVAEPGRLPPERIVALVDTQLDALLDT